MAARTPPPPLQLSWLEGEAVAEGVAVEEGVAQSSLRSVWYVPLGGCCRERTV